MKLVNIITSPKFLRIITKDTSIVIVGMAMIMCVG